MEDARYFDEGKLVVFKRNQIYQHRSFLNGTCVWRTLKTSTLEEAIAKAHKAHYSLQALHEQGLPIKAKLFRDVIDEYVASREKSAAQGKTKPGMLRQIKRVVKFWHEYAGSKPIHTVGACFVSVPPLRSMQMSVIGRLFEFVIITIISSVREQERLPSRSSCGAHGLCSLQTEMRPIRVIPQGDRAWD